MPFAWQLAGLLSSLLHIPAIASGGDYRKQSLYFTGVGWLHASGGDYQQNRVYILQVLAGHMRLVVITSKTDFIFIGVG